MSLEQLHATRAEQRKQRLLEAERELAAEEAEALKMTEEQRQMLLKPFKSVKAEFADLDGHRWTQSALRKFQPPQRRASHVAAPSHSTAKKGTFVVLSNADLASFSPDETIRVSSSVHQRPAFPSPLLSSKPLPTAQEAPCRHRDGTHSRSPVKGLFQRRSDPSEGNATHEASMTSKIDSAPQFAPPDEARHIGLGRGRVTTLGPPGLTPIPSYIVASASPSPESSPETVSTELPNTWTSDVTLRGKPLPTRHLTRRHTTSPLVPFPLRDAPSPPTSASSIQRSPSSPFLSSLSLTDSLTNRPSDLLSPPPRRTHSPRSARARLRSLLHDEKRRSTAAPSSPAPRAIQVDGTPTPLDLSSIVTAISLSDAVPYDDDETPRPSPTADCEEASPSLSWIRSFT
ncbi:hypothetical protein BDZ97DRAFT_1916063 [Flammula alnicola]|nr:hypothetical protein BDZ97DRAFT_1916063 [Flammula alnicola]